LDHLLLIAVLSSLAGACGPEDHQIFQVGSRLKGNCSVTLSGVPAAGNISTGTMVALTATGSCQSGTPEYHISARDPVGAWTTLKAWGAANTVNWDTTGLADGAHRLLVKVRAVNSGDSWEGYDYSRTYTLSSNGGPCTAATISSSPTSPQAAGTSVTITGTATCPAGTTAEYRFVTRGPDMVWRQARGWSSSLTYSWDTTSVQDGRHTFYFYARDQGTATAYDAYAGPLHYDITTSAGTCSQATIAASPQSPQASGAQVTLTASSTCTNGAQAHYRFVAYKPDNSYVQLRGWGSSTTHTWDTTGQDTGTWQLQVYSRRQGSSSPAEGISTKLPYTLTTGTTAGQFVFVSVNSAGNQGNNQSRLNDRQHQATRANMISADGRYMVFDSEATNLDPAHSHGGLFIRDHQTGTTEKVSIDPSGAEFTDNVLMQPTLSNDGRYVAFTYLVLGPSSNYSVYLRDRQTNTTTLISSNHCYRPAFAANGGYLTFRCSAPHPSRNIHRYVLATGVQDTVSTTSTGAAHNGSYMDWPSISADGRYVAFVSDATNLVAGDTNSVNDVFVKDMQTGAVVRANVSSSGQQATRDAWHPAISADGRYVTFLTKSADLWGKAGTAWDMAVIRDLQAGTTSLVSQKANGQVANNDVTQVSTAAGGYVAFTTYATNLDTAWPGIANAVFLKHLASGTVKIVGPPSGVPNGWVMEPSMSSNGRFLLFATLSKNLATPDTNGFMDVLRYTVY